MQHIRGAVCEFARENDFELILSKHKLKRIESCELVRELRDQGRQDLAFHSRPFVLCGLPIRRSEAGTLKYARRNGRFVLEIIGHPDYGLPFGQDRLIPLWVATLAVRQKSKTILFRSAAEILQEFDLPAMAHTIGGWSRVSSGSSQARSISARRRKPIAITSGTIAGFTSSTV